jgi:hypothetical protein
LSRQKLHYFLVYFLLRFGDNLPAWHTTLLADPGWRRVTGRYPTFADTLRRIARNSDPAIIDCLTFSALPVYFSYFFTEVGIDRFCEVLRLVVDKPDIHDAYARAAFVSPLFLAFASSVFRPILSPLLPDGCLPSARQIAVEITRRWEANLGILPAFIVRLFRRSPHPQRTLSNSFFSVALDAEAAPIFGLVSFFQILTPELIALLRSLLTIEASQPILARLVELSLLSTSAQVPYLDEDDKTDLPLLFQRCLISSVDLNCYCALPIRGQLVMPSVYEVYAYMMAGEEEGFSVHNLAELTMTGLRPGAALRHLLQAADPLPEFDVEPELPPRDFFIQYLARRGPHETYAARMELFEALDASVDWKNRSQLNGLVRKASLERTKELRALSAFSRIDEKYRVLDALSGEVREDIRKAFAFRLLLPTFKRKVRNPIGPADAAALLADFPKANTPPPPNLGRNASFFPELAYGYLTQRVSFEAFRQARQDLRDLDQALNQRIGRESSELIPGLFQTNEWLHGEVMSLRSRPYLFEIIQRAAMESNPIPKVAEFARVFGTVSKVLALTKANKGLGEDEFMPAKVAFVFLSNPPWLASNFVFINQFCLRRELEGLFDDSAVLPNAVLTYVIKALLDMTIEDLIGRAGGRKCPWFVTGQSS